MSGTERPITSATEDTLDRQAFVERLCDGLVDPASGVSSGIVLGITGPWGSGKSSILNMMEDHLRKKYEDVVILRFDPWLITGRNDLVSQFLAELTFAINERARDHENLKKIGSQLATYGAMVSPGINLVAPGLGSFVQGGFKAATKALSGEASISSMRRKLITLLDKVDVPIVVLVDELDRIEDAEILTVAQLVRAVVDFPRVSFALAYDVDRVMEALGRSSTERGRSYLEKIVQLQVPIPILLPAERAGMLRTELEKMDLKDAHGGPLHIGGAPYNDIVSILVEGFLDTPRDLKRLTGTFRALYGMVGHEVSWIENLGYSALLSKYPNIVEQIRRNPERVVYNALDTREIERRNRASASDNATWLQGLLEGGSADRSRRLLIRLFPILDRDADVGTPLSNALAFRRPLLTLLRLGIIPGDISRSEVETLMTLSREDAGVALTASVADGRLSELIDRVDGVASEKDTVDIDFWLAISDLAKKPDESSLTELPVQRNLVGEVVGVLNRAVARNPELRPGFQNLMKQLAAEQEFTLLPAILRHQFFAHGMYGYQQNADRTWIMSQSMTQELSDVVYQYIRERFDNGSLLGRIYSPDGLYLLKSVKRSDTTISSAVDSFMSNDGGLDTMTILWFGTGYTPNKAFIDQYCDAKTYLVRAKTRRRMLSMTDRALDRIYQAAESGLQR